MSSTARVLGLVVLLLALAIPAGATPQAPELGHAGRWLTDEQGRVVTVHGVNMVYKYPPYFPAAGGFGEDDARYLAEHGINAVRLGFAWNAVEPQPGVYDDDYIRQIRGTQQLLARYGIYSLIDSHQDGYNESVGASWSGFPAWATITDGFPVPPAPGFPLVYFTSPAQNQTWANLWRDRAAPDGIGLREHYAAMWANVAGYFADQPYVLGYDLINEPWPGWEYPTCFPQGCPRFENDVLAPFQAAVMDAIRGVDRDHLLFYEPSVTNDFGTPNWMPNPTGDPNAGMSFHDYCFGAVDTCVTNGLQRADTEGVVGVVTEFGATTDQARLTRLADRFDDHMASWMLWSQPQDQTPGHPQEPPTGPNLMNPAIVRPYPRAVAGTPQQWHYDSATGTFTLRYSDRRADSGQPFARDARTEVYLPQTDYPGGYLVETDGAEVVSQPDARVLELTTTPGHDVVEVTVTRR
ncbi:cellulase family glycosylhydrolase [Nocardia bovistercoris]|uniref:Cellulase family glycosylhydrolase n=1 Tax=Nocardia bovistercoris TaxID=2785916 RepID=A0A931IB94_9NOCA|nr:cellulase family glycosylhydrolase [Nocardia bovistercoris]MBH0777328.1 cellulase family glycosylhydrolase [Nocardia bovistercoris]